MIETVRQLEQDAKSKLASIRSSEDLESFRLTFLSKKGKLQELVSKIGKLQGEERKTFGKEVNLLKRALEDSFKSEQKKIQPGGSKKETFDETLPSIRPAYGRIAPAARDSETNRDSSSGE